MTASKVSRKRSPEVWSISRIVCLRLVDRVGDVGALLDEEAVPLFLLLVLVGGQQVDRAEPLEDLAAAVHVGLELGQGLGGRLGHLGQAGLEVLAVALLEVLGVLLEGRLGDALVADLGARAVALVAQLDDGRLEPLELGGALVDPLLGRQHLAL